MGCCKMGFESILKVSWANFSSIDSHYAWIEVIPDMSINFN